MKIAFVAPAFKVDHFLPEFFDSFKNLKNDFEIILVNDEPGKDMSRWETKIGNNVVTIINNEKNVGSKTSRFNGLKHLSDDVSHVIFIDPDDKLSSDCKSIPAFTNPTQFAFNLWYKNKMIPCTADGDISKYKLDNHLWGIVFPKEIATQIPRYSHDLEIDDMPIKMRMAENYVFDKVEEKMIDYRVRKGSQANSKKTRIGAIEQVNTWDNLYKIDNLISKKQSVNNQYFELVINKKSFEDKWYKSKHKELGSKVSLLTKFNAHMYRLVSWWTLQNKLKSIFFNRQMFD